MSTFKAKAAVLASLRELVFCLDSSTADVRVAAALFPDAIMRARKAIERGAPRIKAKATEISDYNIDRIRLKARSPRLCVQFMDGEAIFTHCPSAPDKPLNVGRALRVAICMWRYRVYRRLGYRQYETTIPVPEIFQVRCLETDELFDPRACNAHTAGERASNDPERAAAMFQDMQAAA